jgi:hypothetical protein
MSLKCTSTLQDRIFPFVTSLIITCLAAVLMTWRLCIFAICRTCKERRASCAVLWNAYGTRCGGVSPDIARICADERCPQRCYVDVTVWQCELTDQSESGQINERDHLVFSTAEKCSHAIRSESQSQRSLLLQHNSENNHFAGVPCPSEARIEIFTDAG